MITADQIAEDVLQFVCNRVNVTLGTRDAIRKYVTDKVEPLAPRAQSKIDFDVTAGKHQGNPQSVKAAQDGAERRPNQRKQIWTWLHSQAERGGTVEEISKALTIRYTTVSARCSEMKAEGIIKESGRTRPTETQSDAAVLVVI